ncbi:MAG: PorT family protein [Bacteroidales bacterium]|nr:PorT family protein [Bacteroidales bacterium]
MKIKKLTLLFPLLFLSSFCLLAQYNTPATDKNLGILGIESGLNYIIGNTYQNNNLKLHAGISYEYYISPRRSFRMKVKYFHAAKSSYISGWMYASENFITQYESDMLAVPVFYKWQFGKKKFTGYLFGGPYFALELNAQYQNYMDENDYSANDFGTYQGLGAQYSFNNYRTIIYGDIELYKGASYKAPLEFGDLFMYGLFLNKNLINLHFSFGVKFKL